MAFKNIADQTNGFIFLVYLYLVQLCKGNW